MALHHVSYKMTIITSFIFPLFSFSRNSKPSFNKISKTYSCLPHLSNWHHLHNNETNEGSKTCLRYYFSWFILPCKPRSRLVYQQPKPQCFYPLWHNQPPLPFCLGCPKFHSQSKRFMFDFITCIWPYSNSTTCIYTNNPCVNFAVCSDLCKHLEFHSLNPRHKFLHSYGILCQWRHGWFKCHGGVGGIKRSQWRDQAVLSWWGHSKSGGSW